MSKKLYNRSELWDRIQEIIPHAVFETDNHGQLVIYTGLYYKDIDHLTDEEPERAGGQ